VNSLILATAARYLLPLLLLFSVFLLLRGHNAPGGGFAGGLVAAAAFALYGVAHGTPQTRRTLAIAPRTLIGAGLLVACSAGMLSLARGLPFLTGLWMYVDLPGIARLELGTPVLFDLGVYMAVLGVALMIILSLAEVAEGQVPLPPTQEPEEAASVWKS
jgi:multicomponent Na+:H+ antiporter subunit B